MQKWGGKSVRFVVSQKNAANATDCGKAKRRLKHAVTFYHVVVSKSSQCAQNIIIITLVGRI
jgi:RNase P protein component